ncbi:hypothetical protein ACOJUR_08020 [Alicyclobacillus tolerans]|uniref:UbiA prenyltransferase family protein n=2 Tax=Alicyclobacillus tolerans TaxID=90970 RepID=A0A1M6X853_9BACL|nr:MULTISPECIES: hypothetical protein [Alicyclobacillus]MDP9728937.1 asparagine N-glycosylation enzyme membrane subunit Stt3 [Alicyclobacillus tengchongensis]QRF23639.1 hypothetical protein FY534_08100 [Alicyclobacillus sp. TC]SHL02114.1 hypothetical protein SAMN05443507_13234 [Alicyclobacillus montanus]
MSGDWLDFLRPTLSLLLVIWSLQMMDDVFKAEQVLGRGERTLAAKIGRHVLPFTGLCLLIAGAWQAHVALAMFFGVSALRFFPLSLPISRRQLLSKFSLIVVMWLCSLLFVGTWLAVWGIVMAIFLECMLSLLQYHQDHWLIEDTLSRRLGIPLLMLGGVLALGSSFWISSRYTISFLVALSFWTAIAEWTTDRLEDWHISF